MNTPEDFSEKIRRLLQKPARGVVGLVAELLALCGDHDIQLDWQVDSYRMRSFGGERQELKDVSLRNSVFRAVLARIAALCNERVPNLVSPYGGQCELPGDATGSAGFRITFVNTPAEQRLELLTVPRRGSGTMMARSHPHEASESPRTVPDPFPDQSRN